MQKPVYLDYNATTPIAPQVAEAMRPYIYENFGNPSSSHAYGIAAKKGVEKARRQVAEMLGCQPDEIVFTSGGSESNNLAIKGAAFAYREKGNHIITSAVEHPAVLDVVGYLEKQGFRITILPVDEYGMVDPKAVEKAITPDTILISIMHANNEVGTIEPIYEIAEIAHVYQVLMHTDAAQSVGKIAVQVDELGVDLLSIAGHKLYAPKGIGALYIRRGVRVEKIMHGAEHEMNKRAGTENVIEIAALGQACELIRQNLPEYQAHMLAMRAHLEEGLRDAFPNLKFNGHPEKHLPNTTNVSFYGLEANTILAELDQVAASAGAACHADQVDVSPVIAAMGIPVEYAMGTIRFSVGRNTTEEEIDFALEEIKRVIGNLQTQEHAAIKPGSSDAIKLTHYTHGLGCACKLRPQLLEEVLADMKPPADQRILVGTETGDDAAVYLINPETAIVQTVDFFTPIVDDPYSFGAISAANSLSDIYAMGATPLFALNIVGFPSNRLPISVLREILHGAQDKAAEAGISIIGGHSVDDTEPKYGMAVTGMVHPGRLITNAKSQIGDRLILTKPIGTGILTTALKQGLLEKDPMERLIKTMATLNQKAGAVLHQFHAHACTDVTGFGLLGHLLGMMKAAGLTAVLDFAAIPVMEGAYDLAAAGVIPGGSRNNHAYTKPFVQYAEKLTAIQQLIVNDAQTSGGLLVAVDRAWADQMKAYLTEEGIPAFEIGSVIGRQGEMYITVK
ncbi:MAG: selenide, water dikinase SelD [Anaerolineaceae bacterium]|jgi:cysteine desulfurase NifS/selenium donor protein|nr:MAG: selenide, water dikinase SelD [Anaerolineaceae bacterium]